MVTLETRCLVWADGGWGWRGGPLGTSMNPLWLTLLGFPLGLLPPSLLMWPGDRLVLTKGLLGQAGRRSPSWIAAKPWTTRGQPEGSCHQPQCGWTGVGAACFKIMRYQNQANSYIKDVRHICPLFVTVRATKP